MCCMWWDFNIDWSLQWIDCYCTEPALPIYRLAPTSVTSQLLWPSATTNYGGRKEGLCDLSNVVASTNNGGLAATKLITKLGKISRNGNTDDQSYVYAIRSATDVRSSSRAAPNSSAKWSTISSQKGRAPYGRNKYLPVLEEFTYHPSRLPPAASAASSI